MVEFELGLAPARTKASSGPRERSEEQKEYDALVQAVHVAWVAAGKPSKSSEKPAARIPVKALPDGKPDAKGVAEVEKAVRSAGRHLKVAVGFPGYEPGKNKGDVLVIVTSQDRSHRKTSE